MLASHFEGGFAVCHRTIYWHKSHHSAINRSEWNQMMKFSCRDPTIMENVCKVDLVCAQNKFSSPLTLNKRNFRPFLRFDLATASSTKNFGYVAFIYQGFALLTLCPTSNVPLMCEYVQKFFFSCYFQVRLFGNSNRWRSKSLFFYWISSHSEGFFSRIFALSMHWVLRSRIFLSSFLHF